MFTHELAAMIKMKRPSFTPTLKVGVISLSIKQAQGERN